MWLNYFQKNTLILLFLSTLVFVSCQGDKSTKPPVLPIQNMVEQTSYGPQKPNSFYPDKRATRAPLPNTVAQGEARTNVRYDKGQDPRSTENSPIWVTQFPMKLNKEMLLEGQKNFNIYCSTCHGLSGHNDGLVTKYSQGSIRPAALHDPSIIARPVGKIYDAITNGVNNWNMPGFSAQLTTAERWGVVAYVRALQLSESPKDIKKGE